MAFDYKKEYKEFYLPPKTPGIVTVPAMNFLAMRGQGDPNEESGAYKQALERLYAVAYTIKMSKMGDHKPEGYFDYVVPPLEGLWWQEDTQGVDYARKAEFRWISLIRLPEFATKTVARHIKPYLGEKIISQVTGKDIQKLYDTLAHHGNRNTGEGLASGTIRGIHAMFHEAMGAAQQAGLIPRNPTEDIDAPKFSYKGKKVLTDEQLEKFMGTIQRDSVWCDFFYTELTTGLRRGEICGLKWEDFDEAHSTLKVRRTIHEEKGGKLTAWDTKTAAGTRTIHLSPSTAALLRERKKTALTEWIFPHPWKPEQPTRPSAAYERMKILLKEAGLPDLRFHDLRHTFATMALENGMDIKTLSAMLGHVSAATTLDIYTHITSDMLSEAAAKIDRGLGNEVAEDSAKENPLTDFQPVMRRTRKPGTGCISQINDHLFEGRYSPTWPDGTKHSKCVYAHTREECEEKLKVLIQQLNAERKAIQDRMRGIIPLDKLTKKQRQIWEYMRLCPDETNYSTIAKGAKVTRHTVAKHFEMIQKMLGIQKTAPHPLLDCQTVPLMV